MWQNDFDANLFPSIKMEAQRRFQTVIKNNEFEFDMLSSGQASSLEKVRRPKVGF